MKKVITASYTLYRKELDYAENTTIKNKRGEYVPAIPYAFLTSILGKRKCSCGEKFWTVKSYRGHYALEHILGL